MRATRRHDGGRGADVELPITPMLDMAFQLLTFFIFTYHPSALEGQLQLALAVDQRGCSGTPGVVDELEPPLPVSVLVRTPRVGDLGAISQLTVETPGGPIAVADLPGLRQYLQGLRQDDSAPRGVTVRADKNLKYACLMDIVDVCKQAGFDRVGFGAPPDLGD